MDYANTSIDIPDAPVARVRVSIRGDLRLRTADLSDREWIAIRQRLTVNAHRLERVDQELEKVEIPVPLYRHEGENIVLPRGATNVLRSVLGRDRIEWQDNRTSSPASFRAVTTWRAHQRDVADRLVRYEQMVGLGATGSGKTGGACACIERCGQRGIVLVPTVDLARQWAREVHRFLGVAAAVCVSGVWTDGDVVIATPETAAKHVDQIVGRFGLVVVDEVQGFATERRVALVGKIDARYRLALTATLPLDHRREILRLGFGEVRFRYSVSDGIAAGFLLEPEYIAIPTDFDAAYEGPDDWHPLVERLIADECRNRLIVRSVVERCAGVLTLVLSVRKAHLGTLERVFVDAGLRVGVLHGDVPRREREATLEGARAGALDVLLGSVVADEGLDIPNLGALALAFPGRSEPRLLQRIGRVVRAAPGKARPIVLDFTDSVGPLEHQARVRAGVFARTFGPRIAA